MKKFVDEFKDFALKGNVMELAIGVVIGGAFNKIVSSLVNDVIMPIIGVITGGINFNDYKIILSKPLGKKPSITLNIGMFIQNIVNFLIIALSIFLIIKLLSKFEKKQNLEGKENTDSEEVVLLREIRDSLKKS